MTDFEGTIHADETLEWKWALSHGTFAFHPAGLTLRSNMTAGRYIQILQSGDTYANLGLNTVRGGRVQLESKYALSDPLVAQIVLTIAKEIKTGLLDHILVDALNTALAVQISRLCGNPPRIALAPSNGLSRERLNSVHDYIEGHLDSHLTLTDLASVTDLSPFHFSRSFKQAVGVGPWHYVMQRRLERAKTLMRRTNRSLASIAQDLGFADQSHFTSVFRKEIGVTPGRFRAGAQ